MKTNKYAVNDFGIFQWIELPKIDETGWHLVFDAELPDNYMSPFISAEDFNEDAFAIVEYLVDLFDANARGDEYDQRIATEELYQEAEGQY